MGDATATPAFFAWQVAHVAAAVPGGAWGLWHPSHLRCSAGLLACSLPNWKFSNWWHVAQADCPTGPFGLIPCGLWHSSQATPPCSACGLTSLMGRTGTPPADATRLAVV